MSLLARLGQSLLVHQEEVYTFPALRPATLLHAEMQATGTDEWLMLPKGSSQCKFSLEADLGGNNYIALRIWMP